MNLVLDIGNSTIKGAVFDHSTVVYHWVSRDLEMGLLSSVLAKYNVEQAIISSTRLPNLSLQEYLSTALGRVLVLDNHTAIPLKNRYATPETLGPDRLAAAVGAYDAAPGKELLIFDFGTALTIDRVSAQGEFLGGNISLGLSTRFAALHSQTAKLPLCSLDTQALHGYGSSTFEAIQKGVMQSVRYEIEGYISENDDKIVFFTGADAIYFVESLKNTIFVDCELVSKGLNRILEYNAQ